MSKVRVRTSFTSGNERLVLVGEVDPQELSHQMKMFNFAGRVNHLRPGQVGYSEGSKIAVSSDAMACINAMTPDGSVPMNPDPQKVNVTRWSRLVYKGSN